MVQRHLRCLNRGGCGDAETTQRVADGAEATGDLRQFFLDVGFQNAFGRHAGNDMTNAGDYLQLCAASCWLIANLAVALTPQDNPDAAHA